MVGVREKEASDSDGRNPVRSGYHDYRLPKDAEVVQTGQAVDFYLHHYLRVASPMDISY